MKKSLTLATTLALGVTASAYAANPFSDVPQGHWAYDSVQQFTVAGVIEGYDEGAFGGDKLLTRYEMAQVVAKAMAKGANCDKLAAEFADELDTLGVRVTKLEKGADAVKVTGEVRYHYADKDVQRVKVRGGIAEAGGDFYENQLRTRIWVQGQVNDDWKYIGMIQNTQEFDNEAGEENIQFQRAYVEGKLGGVDVTAGRYNAFLVNGNLYDTRADGIEVSYGKDIKWTAFYMKPTDQDGTIAVTNDPQEVDLKYGNAWGVKVDTNVGAVKATAGYTIFEDGELQKPNGLPASAAGDNKIWNFGVAFDITKDLALTADYLKADMEKVDVFKFDGDDGLVIGLNYKGANASEPGTYGVYANYYDQARGTVIAHTMNGYYGVNGFKGYMVGANYTVAKNIVASLEWYDLESKGMEWLGNGTVAGHTDPKQDMQTLWAQVVFTF